MLRTRRHSIVVPWDSLCYQCIPADCTALTATTTCQLAQSWPTARHCIDLDDHPSRFRPHRLSLAKQKVCVLIFGHLPWFFREVASTQIFYQHRLLIASPPLRVLISDPLRTLHNCTYYYFIDYCNISWSEGEIIVISQLEFLNGKIWFECLEFTLGYFQASQRCSASRFKILCKRVTSQDCLVASLC